MNTSRKSAILVGVFYIAATVAGILSLVFTEPVLNSPDYLVNVSANTTQVTIGVLLLLIDSAAVVGIAVMMFPILKKHNEALALGAVVFRGALEAVIYIAIVINWLLLISLSREYVKEGTRNARTVEDE